MLVIRLLGPLALESDGKSLDLPSRRHGQLLLGYLALNPGLHARREVAALLWPDVLGSSARSSLRSALSSVRRALGEHAQLHLVTQRDRIGLSDSASVDVREFQALVAAGKLEAAAGMGGGVPLQGLDGHWVEQARQEHRGRLLEVLEALAVAAEARDDRALAVRYTRDQVALDPLAEAPNRELIRRLAAAGDRAAALAAYARLSESFRTLLSSAPSLQTRQLVARIRATGDEAAEATWVALPLQAALRVHVPLVLVGRSAELRQLATAMDAAGAGERQVVLVGGEPGIGKTALLAHFADSAAASATVLFGRCSSGSAVALAPFAEALRHYAARASTDRLLRELPPVASQLVGLVPELAESAFELPAAAAEIEIGQGGRLVRVLVETLLAICREHPLVLIVDDVQDADSATLAALGDLVATSEAARLLVLAAYRDTEAGRLDTVLRQLRRLPSTRSVPLRELGPQEIGKLATASTGKDLPADFVDALHERSGGNPLFAQELARRATEGGAGPPTSELVGSPLPVRVSDLILDELAKLTPETRRALSTASALGDEFDLASVACVMGRPPAECLDALDEAVAAKVVRELPDSVGRYQFRHSLIRETLYSALTATRRAHLHLHIAEALEAMEEGGGRAPVRAVAEHLAKARELAPRPKLGEYTVRAAREAAATFAHDDAALLYERATALAGGDGRKRCALLLDLGNARRRAGHTAAARDAFLEASRLATRLVELQLRAEAALGVCTVPDFSAAQLVDGAAVELLREALESLPPCEDSTRARLLAQLATQLYLSEEHEAVRALVDQAQELARATGDPLARSAALDAAHMIRRGSGDPHERLALADKMLELGRSQQDPAGIALAHVRRSADLFELGDFAGVRREREALTSLAQELRQPLYLWWTRLWRATEAIFTASPEAESLAAEAYRTGRAGFGVAAALEFGAQTFWLRLEEGRLAERAPEVDATLKAYAVLPAVRAALARIDAEEGRLDAAAQALEQLTGPELSLLRHEAGWRIVAALLAEVTARVEDGAAARRLRSAIGPSAGRWATSAFGSLCFGPLSASLALVCAVAGSSKEASRHRQDALDQCAAAGAKPAAARLEREYGRLSAR